MIGPTQQIQSKLFYTSFNLDDRIRPDNPLRKIRQLLDFSWVRPTVAELYGSTDNPSIDPIVLLKLMLILMIEKIPSERELMRRLQERLDWLWFCQYDLDSKLPDHSVLSKARRRWGKDVFATLFSRILQQCIDASLVDGSVLHIDSSLIQGDVSVDSLQPAWAVQAQQLYQQLDQNGDIPEDETADNTSSESSPTASTPPKKLSPTDPDARPRVKGSQKVIGYQEHRCVDDAHGIITATKTTDASVHEGLMLEAMLDEHRANTDSRPETMVGDKAYGQADNYKTRPAGSATHLLRAGVDINTIRAWLGHVSVDTANVYAESDLESLTFFLVAILVLRPLVLIWKVFSCQYLKTAGRVFSLRQRPFL